MSDRERWDDRHESRRFDALSPADRWVAACLDRLGAGRGRRAVDVASGTGRHAVELGRRGWAAEAWDVSPVALDIAASHAMAHGVDLTCTVTDLAGDKLPRGGRADAIVVCDYLDRELLVRLGQMLAPGGHLIAVTFTVDWPGAHPSARFRLARGELSGGITGLETVCFSEEDGRAGILARRD